MLDLISDGFRQAKDRLRGVATLTEDNTKEAVELLRTSLLEADVEYGVVQEFIKEVRAHAYGEKVDLTAGRGSAKLRVSPSDHFIQICKRQLEALMGDEQSGLTLPERGLAKVMMVGLQGSGKTTTTAKLCRYLQNKKRKPLLVAADIYRPAAVEQLRVLGQRLGVPVSHTAGAKPVEICKNAVLEAQQKNCDVVIFDTAGRLAIDEPLMQELSDIKTATSPDQILFVCDAMMGQDAVQTARAFNERLEFDGVIMTKLDGDSRGGAALSIRKVTGKPIKFLGLGEDLERLEEFRPEGLASRILGLGDIVGLMQDFERVAEETTEQDQMRMLQGQFNFKDFYEQLSMIQKMGSLKDLMAKLPLGGLPKDINLDDKELVRIKAMISSMTEKERLQPSLIDESRGRRIAKGSGRKLQEVSDLIKKFKQMRQMMGTLGKSLGMLSRIPGMGALKQMGQMKQMAQAMMSGGGGFPAGLNPAMAGGMADLLGGGMRGAPGTPKPVDRDKLRKKKKAERKARKKNRKK